jgi:hypothetical protein
MYSKGQRWMYNPDTGEIVYGVGGLVYGSHATDHHAAGTATDYDDFVRGWIRDDGVIQFRTGLNPNQFRKYPDKADRILRTLEYFAKCEGVDKHVGLKRAGFNGVVEFGEAYPNILGINND